MNPYNRPADVTSRMLGYSASAIKKWKGAQTTGASFDRPNVSGRPTKAFPTWAHISIRNIIFGWYGVKWAPSERRYPTVKSVMEEFYNIHSPVDNPGPVDVPTVSETLFRKEIKKAGESRTNQYFLTSLLRKVISTA